MHTVVFRLCCAKMSKQLAILCLIINAGLTGVKGKCETEVEEATWAFVPGRDSSHFGILTVEECFSICSSHSECLGYTWRFDDVVGWCFEYALLEDLHACAGCFSGTVPSPVEGACAPSPENVIGVISTDSSNACSSACADTDGCLGYTWYDSSSAFPNFCFQYSDCSQVTPCEGCSSGILNCFASESSTTISPTTISSAVPTTLTTSQTTTTTTTASAPPPPECTNYRVMDESDRNEKFGIGELVCDQDIHNHRSPNWEGDGYYRMREPAGVRIPTQSPGEDHCGTWATGWIRDNGGAIDNMQVGDKVNVEACFHGDSNPCDFKNDITVTKCPGDYFVYYLVETPYCRARYCATMDP